MMPTRDDWECDSGPYCEHWGTPGACDECTAELVKPYIEPLEAEIARLKAEVKALQAPLHCLACANHGAEIARLRRAIAAGPAALRAKGHTVRLMHPEFAAEWVEAAQEAAMRGGG